MKPKSTHEKHRVPVGTLDFGLIVISDTRYREIQTGAKSTDETTAIARKLIEEAGHKLASVSIVPDEPQLIIKSLNEFVGRRILVIITSGGTGLSPRDVTIETITPLFEKRIPGFGEIFRFESYKDIGTAAMLTRAEAGTYKGAVIFCLPGSPNAVHTALTSLILPEIEHIISHMKTKISKDSKEEK